MLGQWGVGAPPPRVRSADRTEVPLAQRARGTRSGPHSTASSGMWTICGGYMRACMRGAPPVLVAL